MQTKSVPFAFKKEGIYYFTRRVPADLRSHYSTERISFSLRTRSAREGSTRAAAIATKLDEFWLNLRMQAVQVPGKHRLLSERERKLEPSPTLSEAKDLYLALKGKGKSKTFHAAAERAVEYLSAACGDKALLTYKKSDATAFRDWLFSRGLGSKSVERVFSTVRAMVSFALAESGITAPNPFAGIFLDGTIGGTERLPISPTDLAKVQARCMEMDDDLRWLIALISDTGLRLAEAAGLACSDIVLDAKLPHIIVRTHSWRSLKTSCSERIVPLVGASLWAAHRIVANASSPFAFPRYNDGKQTNANSASAALNKWLSNYVPDGCVIHSFRHSLRDRLRAVECPADVVDQLGGWATAGEGQGYGRGYPLGVLQKWMRALESPANRLGLKAAE